MDRGVAIDDGGAKAHRIEDVRRHRLGAVSRIAPLLLVENRAFAAALDPGALAALVTLFLRLHGSGVAVNQIFWGLWLFPFALLVIRSGFIPRFLGYLMMLAGVGYLANAFTVLTRPDLSAYVSPVAGWLYLGEIPIIFWLLIWGARPRPGATVPETHAA